MTVCANKSCTNKGNVPIGIFGKVRLLCNDCFDIVKYGGKITDLKPIDPQERFILSAEDNKT